MNSEIMKEICGTYSTGYIMQIVYNYQHFQRLQPLNHSPISNNFLSHLPSNLRLHAFVGMFILPKYNGRGGRSYYRHIGKAREYCYLRQRSSKYVHLIDNRVTAWLYQGFVRTLQVTVDIILLEDTQNLLQHDNHRFVFVQRVTI